MSEKIFILCQDDLGNYEIRYDDKIFHFLWEVAPILNEQQSTIEQLQDENEQLKSIKKFAEDRGINIFNISEAFQRCWEDNAKLVEENEQLRTELEFYNKIINFFTGTQ